MNKLIIMGIFMLGCYLCSADPIVDIAGNIKIGEPNMPELVIEGKDPVPLKVLQDKKERLDMMKTRIDEQLTALESNPEKVVNDRIKKIDDVLKTLPDRKVNVAGRITMKEMFQRKRDDIAKDTADYVRREKMKLSEIRTEIEGDISTISAEIVSRQEVAE